MPVLSTAAAISQISEQSQSDQDNWLAFFMRGQAFADLAVALDWPPPWHLPVRSIDRIAKGHRSGELSEAEVEAEFVGFYDSDVLNAITMGWRRLDWLGPRLEILEEGIGNYAAKRYFSAVCTLLPQVEGVLYETLGKKPNPKNDAPKIFRDTRLSKIAEDFYVRVLQESFDWRVTAAVPTLSRHAILHGRSVAYGTAKHALKVVIVADIVIAGIEERRRLNSEPHEESDTAEL
jgi:hypothetical protein